MLEVSLQERLLHNIFFLELLARIGMSSFFGLSVFGFAYLLNTQEQQNKLFNLILNISRILFLFGTISILTYSILEYILPLNSMTAKLYTINSSILALGVLYFNPKHKEFPTVSFIISALIFLSMTLISFLEPKILIQSEKSIWLINAHILFSILGETIFIISLCASFLFIVNHSKLKRKVIINSTSLSTLEKIVFRSSFLGLAFITLALISGIVLVSVGKSPRSVGFIKIFWAFFIWGWYAITLFGRNFWGWKGRKGAWLIIIGSIFLLLGLLGNLYHYL